MKYVDVIIDNKSEHTDVMYTYGCEDDSIRAGQKVYVPFSQGNRIREGYVFRVADEPDQEYKNLKYIESADEDICLNQEIVDTCIWMKHRYLCKYIDGIKCFTPAGSKSRKGKVRDPFKDIVADEGERPQLTDQQQAVLAPVEAALDSGSHERFLLYGVTGSGKTEVYMRAAEKCIAGGRQVIMLVPEISLTHQVIRRFIGRFGAERMAVLHSRLSAGERYDEWMRIKSGQVDIVIGARSAVFAPLEKIGLIILDEEHETTYKSDMTPKYDTVEVALKRLQQHAGVLIAGSATPSVATFFRSEQGIYKRLELTERYNQVALPEVSVVDMREELRNGNRSVISRKLYDGIRNALENKQQVILFLNRRGYSTFVSCRECGKVLECPDCGISLTYHKEKDRAVCHYCGHEIRPPKTCPDCGSKYIRYFGTGTEKVEEAVKELFPEASIERLDLDSARKKGSLDAMLKRFGKGKTDILIGTQLVAKGLDFRNVALVGIVSADVTLHIPDYRSPERTFQLITQAAGRAGRGDIQGKVVIQSYTPDNYAVQKAAAQDYRGFYEEELMLRGYMGYPPYSDLFQVVFSGKSEQTVKQAAEKWHMQLEEVLSQDELQIFRPQPAPMNRIKETYRWCMLIKSPQGKRRMTAAALEKIKQNDKSKKNKYAVTVDINPYSFI
ncbi:MAG: primosomal protein N' [Firmicutes bacterium]|nr:primosomal protein N' [Bacillota bacterium]